MPNAEDIARMIDHTILKAEATWSQVKMLCDEALENGFASVCVNPIYVSRAKKVLGDSDVKACCVVGFPLGANETAVKAHEAATCVKTGADEIDFVAHLPYLLDNDVDKATAEFKAICDAARAIKSGVTIKVIIESACLMAGADEGLAEQRIATACQAAAEAGCDFVKTSTGFHSAGGSTVEAVTLMKKHAGSMQVKASGGIRTFDDAIKMIDAGATRLGCSAGVAIMQGAAGSSDY